MYLLDTDIVIHWLRERRGVVDRIEGCRPGELSISAVTLAELYYGAHRSAQVDKNLRQVQKAKTHLQVLAVEDSVAREYGRLRAVLAAEGKAISPNDLFIAATARAHGFTLVTNNTAHFEHIRDLRLESWLRS
jgi:tRNA(fMet)-specific endonuclease VapC